MCATTTPRLLRLPEVIQTTGIARTTIYDLIAAGRFPAPIPLTATARAWRSDEIDAWIAGRTADRDDRTSSRPDGPGGAA